MGPLFFLIYINDLSDNLITNPKLFADDTPLVSLVHDPNAAAIDLNNDLAKINDWTNQSKMNFEPDPFKQAQEVLFSRRIKSRNHSCLHFNNNSVNRTPLQKHLGMYLDPKLDFLEHLKNIQAKVNKSIALLRKLKTIVPRPTLITIYKAIIRLHLDYGDTIYDQAYNDSFHQKLESIQYNAALSITGVVRGTSSGKLYQELGLESLQQRRWNLKLDSDIRNLNSLTLFKSRILKLMRPNLNSIYNCHNPKAIKCLSRIKLGLNHLCEHKFKHSFQDTLIPICGCGSDTETPCHYLISCPVFDAGQITHVLLYGSFSLKMKQILKF